MSTNNNCCTECEENKALKVFIMIKTLSYWSLLSWREQFPKKEKKVKENTTVRRRDGALEKNSHYLVESVGVLLFVIWDQKF